MSAQDDIATLNKLLDEVATRCATDSTYRDSLIANHAETLADAGVQAAVLADALLSQGAGREEVAAYGFEDEGPDQIVIISGRTVARCLTGSGSKGRSCGGNTIVIGRTMVNEPLNVK